MNLNDTQIDDLTQVIKQQSASRRLSFFRNVVCTMRLWNNELVLKKW